MPDARVSEPTSEVQNFGVGRLVSLKVKLPTFDLLELEASKMKQLFVNEYDMSLIEYKLLYTYTLYDEGLDNLFPLLVAFASRKKRFRMDCR